MRIVILLLCFSAAAHCFLWAEGSSCADTFFWGFDSRVKPVVIARLPDVTETPTGFEVLQGRPVVSYLHRLLAFDTNAIAAAPTLDALKSLCVDKAGVLRVQTTGGILRLGSSRLEPDPNLSPVVQGQIMNSGQDLFLELLEKNGSTDFLLRGPMGAALPLFRTTGKVRAASWNSLGLAAIVDNRLLTWESGADKITELAADTGLAEARDVCMVGKGRAVVALARATVLVTRETLTVVVGLPTRCRWESSMLFLLDLRGGLIWEIQGLDEVGTVMADEAHARALLAKTPKGSPETSPLFLEAARLVGCRQARAWR